MPCQLGDSPILTAIGDPLRAILDCEFVDGSGSDERLILHRLYKLRNEWSCHSIPQSLESPLRWAVL